MHALQIGPDPLSERQLLPSYVKKATSILWSLWRRLFQRSGLPTPRKGLVTRGFSAPSPDGDRIGPEDLDPRSPGHSRTSLSFHRSLGADAFGWATGCHSFERNPYRPSHAGSARRALPFMPSAAEAAERPSGRGSRLARPRLRRLGAEVVALRSMSRLSRAQHVVPVPVASPRAARRHAAAITIQPRVEEVGRERREASGAPRFVG